MSEQRTPRKLVSPEAKSAYKEGWYYRRPSNDPEGNVFSKLRATKETNPNVKTRGRSAGKEREKEWVVKQEQRMVAWINSTLETFQVTDLSQDLSDGMMLIYLLEKLTSTKILAKYHRDPTHRLQKLDNMKIVLQFCEEEGIHLVSMNATDIVDGNLKLILSLINQLMKHFQTTPTHKAVMQEHSTLLAWINSALPDKFIINFNTDWRDGKNLSALVDYCKPGLIPDHASLDPKKALENCTRAMGIAEKELGIPQLMHPEFLAADHPDDFTVAFYLGSFMNPKPVTPTRKVSLTAAGPGIVGAKVNENTVFFIRGNVTSEKDLVIKVTNPSGTAVKTEPTALPSGNPSYRYKPTTPGTYIVNISYLGDPITGSPYLVSHALESPPHPELCSAKGKGTSRGIVGTTTEFVVDCTKAATVADSLEVIVEDPNGEKLEISIADQKNDTFKVQYTPQVIGAHTVFVNVADISIIDSPFICLVINPSACVAGGAGLSNATTEHPATFQVVTTDAGPGDVSATIHGPTPVDFVRLSSDNGVYSYQYIPTVKGNYHIDIKLDGQHIRGSPFSVEINEPTVASKCFIRELPISNQRVGTAVTFIVDASQAKDDEIKAIVEGPSFEGPSSCQITQVDPLAQEGVYAVAFTPEAVGEYTAKVWYGGEPIPDSPVDFTVNDPSKCKVDVDAIRKGVYYLGKKYVFRVETYDAGDGDLTCTLIGTQGNYVCNVHDEEHGTKIVSFIPVEVGAHKITLYFDGVLIMTIPITVDSSSFDNIRLIKPGAKYYLINKDVEFRMYAPGADSKRFAVSALGINTGAIPHITLIPGQNDHYSIILSAAYADRYRMEITYNKQQCPGSPFEILICMSPNAENVVSFDPVVPLKAGVPIELFFDTSKAGKVDDGTLTANISVSSGKWTIPYIEEISNDFYRVYFTPSHDDEYTISVFWYGKPVQDSPFNIVFNEQMKEPPVSVQFEPEMGLRSLVTAHAEGETVGRVEVKAQQYVRGQYRLSFVPEKKEVYILHVARFGQPIKGSPFILSLKSAMYSMSVTEREMLKNVTIDIAAREGILSVKVIGRETGPVQLHLSMSMNKKVVQMSFIDRKNDVYDLYIYWNYKLLNGAPFEINVS